jgi:MFS transporter, ACS family, D-galactonate transporter
MIQIPTTPNSKTRWLIPLVLAITVLINYLDRNNLSLAIPRIAQDFSWSDREVGAKGELLLAAFYLSYAISNLLLSPLAERFGPKRSLMAAIGAFSIITILYAPLGSSFISLIVLRLLLGLGEGVHIPMLSAITSHWFPTAERSRANAIWGSGILMSTAIAPLIIIPSIQLWGWRPAFAVLGAIGLSISMPLVYFLVQDKPPRQDRQNTAVMTAPNQQERIALGGYGRDSRFWLAVLGGSLNAFCAFGLLNWLPTYFNRAKGIDFEKLGCHVCAGTEDPVLTGTSRALSANNHRRSIGFDKDFIFS